MYAHRKGSGRKCSDIIRAPDGRTRSDILDPVNRPPPRHLLQPSSIAMISEKGPIVVVVVVVVVVLVVIVVVIVVVVVVVVVIGVVIAVIVVKVVASKVAYIVDEF